MTNLFRSRNILCRFSLGFFLVNILLASLISINYFSVLPNFLALASSKQVGYLIWIFFGISFFAQVSILFLFCLLLVLIFIFTIPNRLFIFTLSIILASALMVTLIIDSIVFNLFHMHYAMLGWEIYKANALSDVISLSLFEKLRIVIVSSISIACESFIAWRVWLYVNKKNKFIWDTRLLGLSVFSIIISYCFTILAILPNEKNNLSINTSQLIVKATRFLPYYDEVFQLTMPINTIIRRLQDPKGDIVSFQAQENNRVLEYPKNTLQFGKSSEQFNIVVIAIDSWRYDALNSASTPYINQFSKKTLQFNNHWSGGNCTKAGLFSLFYGMPANYWDSFLHEKHGPELIKQLIKMNYNMSVFSSASLKFPAFDQTIFRDIKPLVVRTKGETTVERDRNITNNFKKFLSNRKADQPFFSFIFYDAVHNYCEPTHDNQVIFTPSVESCNRFFLNKDSDRLPYLNRYLNAVHFVDSQIKQVIEEIEKHDLLKNTIIILTADHGEEINDNHSGYWQHASAYTPAQLHVPLLIYWPGKGNKIYDHRTTHYDVSVTLMTKLLNCINPIKDYSLGFSLFDRRHRSVLISGSYSDYAVISPDQIVRIYHNGDFSLDDEMGSSLENYSLNISPLQQAFQYLNEYFKI